MTTHWHTPALPAPGIYPECVRVDSIPSGKWRVVVVSPIVQVCADGLCLAACAGFGSNMTSIPEWLPIAREGPWSTASVIHDCTFCTGHGWRLNPQTGAIEFVSVSRDLADEAWRQGHLFKRHTEPSTEACARVHWAGLHAFSARAWAKYEADRRNAHRAAVAGLTVACERAVARLLLDGPSAVEDLHGRPLPVAY